MWMLRILCCSVMSTTSFAQPHEPQIVPKGVWSVETFYETELSQNFCYKGESAKAHLISILPHRSLLIDVDGDEDLDVVLPLQRGYRTGVDTRYPYKVFLNLNGRLVPGKFNTPLPAVSGGHRSGLLQIGTSGQTLAVFQNHGTDSECATYENPWSLGHLTLLDSAGLIDVTADFLPTTGLPMASIVSRSNASDSHSMAIGDYNNDGLDDILVGEVVVAEFSHDYLPYVLLQRENGAFSIAQDAILRGFGNWFDPDIPNARRSYLYSLTLEDFDDDGIDDLLTGWANGDAYSRVFWGSDSGRYSISNSTFLTESIYGFDNQMHIIDFSFDYDSDGDLDILVQYTPNNPYYAGHSLRLYENLGRRFVDVTDQVLLSGQPFSGLTSEPFTWPEHWYMIDVNLDGVMDFVGTSINDPNRPTIQTFISSAGKFTFIEIDFSNGVPFAWGDFDQNGDVEFLSLLRSRVDLQHEAYQVFHYEITGLR